MTDITAQDSLWLNLNLATMADGTRSYGEVRDGAVAIRGDRIAWAGPRAALPDAYRGLPALDGHGGWMTPGLVDCHTHIVHGGNRSEEFEARLNGASYQDIARAGGGILSTVRATREASEDQLAASAARRIRRLMAEGVTLLEVKSGYGLSLDSELKMLRVARALGKALPVGIRTSFLGPHALPPEFAGRPDAYIDDCIRVMLPAVLAEGLADAADAFCETIAFTPQQIERFFDAAVRAGLPVKLHAEQLSDSGGSELVARFGGLSADHIEYLSEAGVHALAQAGTVATLLPGAFYFLSETRKPPVGALRAAGVPMAVATDCNPGTAPMLSVLQAANMACVYFRLTPLEALAGITINAARALGMAGQVGSIETGKQADLAIWDIERPADLVYGMSGMTPATRIYKGRTEEGSGIAASPARA